MMDLDVKKELVDRATAKLTRDFDAVVIREVNRRLGTSIPVEDVTLEDLDPMKGRISIACPPANYGRTLVYLDGHLILDFAPLESKMENGHLIFTRSYKVHD